MQEIEDAKKWLKERIVYIKINCDLNELDNKRAYNSLNIALKYLEERESK